MSATSSVSIAAANFSIRPVGSFDEFADHVRTLLDRMNGHDLVLFPELFTLELFTIENGWEEEPVSALPRVDQYTDDYRALFAEEAQRRNQFIVAGTHLEARRDAFYNVAYIFGPDGERFEHEKTHIFPVEADWATVEGERMETFDLPFARVGFNVCYEAEIPECASTLTEQGAEIILCPSYTFTEHGFWRVRHCAQARAIENQVYFAHCSTGGPGAGPIPPGWTASSILSPADKPWTPNGVVAQADTNVEDVAAGVVDLAALRQNRVDGAATTYKDRRRQRSLYSTWADSAQLVR